VLEPESVLPEASPESLGCQSLGPEEVVDCCPKMKRMGVRERLGVSESLVRECEGLASLSLVRSRRRWCVI
jgi:hypothetical protein